MEHLQTCLILRKGKEKLFRNVSVNAIWLQLNPAVYAAYKTQHMLPYVSVITHIHIVYRTNTFFYYVL